MLTELRVKNFAIIDRLNIDFQPGLNIVSGETGSGKTILLKSLALLMGTKASSDVVRSGKESAVVEGAFDLSRRNDLVERMRCLGLDTNENLMIVRRVISANGKNSIYVNGSLCPLNTLREVVAPLIELAGETAPLIEMTSQHENKNLLNLSYHLDLVDIYSGNMELGRQFQNKYQKLKDLEVEYEQLQLITHDSNEQIEFLQYQRREIEALELDAETDEHLDEKIQVLKNQLRQKEFYARLEHELNQSDQSVLSIIFGLTQEAERLRHLDAEVSTKIQPLEQAKNILSDLVYDVQKYLATLEVEATQLQVLEERQTKIRRLQKKYGASIKEILAAFAKIEADIDAIQNAETRSRNLHLETEGLTQELQKFATELHVRRQNGAELLSRSVNDELKDLNMKGLRFHVQVEAGETLNASGKTRVEFMTQTSRNDPARSLAKSASGGELSRILLALKQVVNDSESPRTFLFDEVDTGVSGRTAEKVGKKLRLIAKGQQVICVTHLPQVAAFGDCHFWIAKLELANGSVQMDVREIEREDRVTEIARLISGERITETSLAHARELLGSVPK